MNIACAVAVAALACLTGAVETPTEPQHLLQSLQAANELGEQEGTGKIDAIFQSKEALTAYASKCSPEDLAALEAEALRMGRAMPDEGARKVFGCQMGTCLPGDAGLRVMAELARGEVKDPNEMFGPLQVIHDRNQPSPLAAKLVISMHQQLLKMKMPLGDEWNVIGYAIQTLGTTGPDAVDYLMGPNCRREDAAEALGAIGTPKAIEFLMRSCRENSDTKVRVIYLEALTGHNLPMRDQEVIAFARTELTQLLSSPEPEARQAAAQIAGYSGDPYFLPALEELSKNDPHNVRETAQKGVESIRYRLRESNKELYKRTADLKRTVDYLRETIASCEKRLAEHPEREQRRVLERRRYEATQQLQRKEAALAAAHAEQEASIQSTVAEAYKSNP